LKKKVVRGTIEFWINDDRRIRNGVERVEYLVVTKEKIGLLVKGQGILSEVTWEKEGETGLHERLEESIEFIEQMIAGRRRS
jgi:hypothetical protein